MSLSSSSFVHRSRALRLTRSALSGLALLASSWSHPALAQDAPAEEPGNTGEGAVPRGPGGAVVREAPPEPPSDAPAPPKIVMPKLTKFVEAPYPKEAEDAGLEATVLLHLDIDREGKVKKVQVVEPAGHGFDEAAAAAAQNFEFEPATRDGQPIPVRIPYRYAFTLKVVEKVVEAPKTIGSLGGTVRISGIDGPLAGADVAVTSVDGKESRTRTDASGKWLIENLEPGVYQIKISAEGFADLKAAEQVTPGEVTEFTLRLSPQVKGLENAIEVTVQGERAPREVTRRTIERKEMQRIPGTSGDALRSIQSLPGVARPPGLAGLLIVRGSAPQDTMVFVDGSSIPLVYHFGGLSSTIPTELLEKIDFYPGNFSARYGQVMGGIVDVSLREPDTSCNGPYGKKDDKRTGCFHGLAQMDLIDGRLLLQGPIGDKWKFAVAGRRSWIDAWLGPVLESAGAGVSTAPVYYDYQALLETRPTTKSRFRLRFFGSDDRLKFLIKDPLAQDPGLGGNLTFGTGFYRGQMLYDTELSRRVDLETMVSVGRSSLDFALGQIAFKLDTTQINARSELGFKIARGFEFHAGLDFIVAPYHVDVHGPAAPLPGEANPGPFTTRPQLAVDERGTIFRPAWYGEAEIRPNRRALIVPGVRLDYARDSGHADISPRLNARYDLIGGRAESDLPIEQRKLRTTIKGGVGVFNQPPQYQETNAVFGTPGLLSNRAIHYSVGVEQELTRQIELSLEGYYKDLTHLVSRSQSLGSLFVYDNAGTGYVVGMETLVKYKPDKRFFGWFAYTLSRAIRQNRPDEQEYLFQYDQTHNLTVLGSYALGNGWHAGARFRLISGGLTTPVLGAPGLPALYAADAATYTSLSGKAFSERLPLFHQLDVRIEKNWQYRDWKLTAYLDIQNVYNNPAREGVVYNYDFTRSTYQTGLPVIPSLGVRGEF